MPSPPAGRTQCSSGVGRLEVVMTWHGRLWVAATQRANSLALGMVAERKTNLAGRGGSQRRPIWGGLCVPAGYPRRRTTNTLDIVYLTAHCTLYSLALGKERRTWLAGVESSAAL
jgi:hypothetical protein